MSATKGPWVSARGDYLDKWFEVVGANGDLVAKVHNSPLAKTER